MEPACVFSGTHCSQISAPNRLRFFGRGERSIGSYTSGLRPPQVQAPQGSLEQALATPARCRGHARADRCEPSASWPDPRTERTAIMGIAVRRTTGAAARCASEAARSTSKAARREKKKQAASPTPYRFLGRLAALFLGRNRRHVCWSPCHRPYNPHGPHTAHTGRPACRPGRTHDPRDRDFQIGIQAAETSSLRGG